MTRIEIVQFAYRSGLIPPNWGATEKQWKRLEDFACLCADRERDECLSAINYHFKNSVKVSQESLVRDISIRDFIDD